MSISASSLSILVIDENISRSSLIETALMQEGSIQRPIAMFVDHSDRASMQAAIDAGVSAYVVDGLRPDRINPILDMAISRFNAYTKMMNDLEQARDELAARKVIDKAKGILMKSRGKA